ncbi:MAG: hypothetical protein KAV69_00860, partial [Deltaproteobacteria bacterium]|nr:hypothetical protein [Deltaproteobacteria bacterium]
PTYLRTVPNLRNAPSTTTHPQLMRLVRPCLAVPMADGSVKIHITPLVSLQNPMALRKRTIPASKKRVF